MASDGRIPVVLADAAAVPGEGEAVVVEGDAAAPQGAPAERFALAAGAHRPGCACCGGRSPAAVALSRLFLAGAKDARGLSRVLVLASPAGRRAVLAALDEDVLVRARFRLAAAP